MSKLKRFGLSLILRIDQIFKIKYVSIFEKLIQNCDLILDLGCGKNSPLGRLKKRKNYTVGVDIFEKYIDISKKKEIHDKYLLLNVLDIDKEISPKSFDCVILLDIIEHLKKINGLKLIKKVEKIAKKKIIISTPNGYIQQHEYHHNIYQIHKSGWDLKIFRKLNFRIYGINGLKYLRGEAAHIKYRPVVFWYLISEISTIFVKYFPIFAYQLFCVKELS